MFYVFIFVFSFLFIYTPMEVVCPVGMFVYTAVYMLAADGAVFDIPEKKRMVRGTYSKAKTSQSQKKKLATHVYSSVQACF